MINTDTSIRLLIIILFSSCPFDSSSLNFEGAYWNSLGMRIKFEKYWTTGIR